ncbi:MAG: polyribonucleotide nucleotidyltransferase [Nitrospinota bacterium]|nr:polyribonucleotide nucleotidyltransferase [Nitrospinota bacterium]
MKSRVETNIGHSVYSIETGEMARQAGGAVLVQFGESIVFASATAEEAPKEGFDFFPLTVDYREKFYAAGRIPGGFFKREARPTEKETLVCRLTDRPLRPLFPKGFQNETQILLYALSHDGENDTDVLAVTAASAALCISNIPFIEPVSAIRVGYLDGKFIVNPTLKQRDESKLDMIVGGTASSITMVEGEVKELTEAVMVEALQVAHTEIKKLCAIQKELADKAGKKEKLTFTEPVKDTHWHDKIASGYSAQIKTAVSTPEKDLRSKNLSALRTEIIEALTTEEERAVHKGAIKDAFGDLQKEIVRKMILEEGKRADGRGLADVRPITIRTGVLPRTHGSVLFTRGETQALVVCTLGSGKDEQMFDNIEGKVYKRFIFHYNFPPFSVGEVKFAGGPGRREIGHGALAGRGVQFCLPDPEEFPYTVRIVSEIFESNGSSSMASVCGGSLALMDAGVKIKAPVAGVAMGLVAEGNKTAILTDILGLEDALGDMDFKVAGTKNGITAIQMDIKVAGISADLMSSALDQALKARLHILNEMEKAMPAPRAEVSPFAPKMITMNIPADMMGMVIGPGGKNIRGITEATDATVDLEDGGLVKIFALNAENANKAKEMIEAMVRIPEVGEYYLGKVVKIMDFGAFVEIAPGTQGLVHISQFSRNKIRTVEDVISEGEELWVKIIEIDQRSKKIRLSHLEAVEDGKPEISRN